MDHRTQLAARALVTCLCLSFLMGCASLRWSVIKQFREPGESLETFPERVWNEYDCESQKRPFLMIERNELTPNRVKPGADFGHRLVYVMCPLHPTEVVAGPFLW